MLPIWALVSGARSVLPTRQMEIACSLYSRALEPTACAPGELVLPAIADHDHAVVHPGAVADDEVVTQAVEALLEMLLLDGLEVAEVFAGVMDHDRRPALGIQRTAHPVNGLDLGRFGLCRHQGRHGQAIGTRSMLAIKGEQHATQPGHRAPRARARPLWRGKKPARDWSGGGRDGPWRLSDSLDGANKGYSKIGSRSLRPSEFLGFTVIFVTSAYG